MIGEGGHGVDGLPPCQRQAEHSGAPPAGAERSGCGWEARDHKKELFRQQLAHHCFLRKDRKHLARIPKSGDWPIILLSRWHSMLLSCDEWRDNIRLSYGMAPLGLCKSCDRCGADFTVEYVVSCKVGGLVSICHSDVRNEARALAVMVTQKSAVSYQPPIYSGTGVWASLVSDSDGNNSDRGNLSMHGLWKRGEQVVLDTQIVDCDATPRRA